VIDAAEMRWGEVEAGLTYAGRGRFLWSREDLWVHWLDADNRTAAVGNPTGQWFAILDRTGKPGERRRAAREVLEWYGYAVRDGAR
jgi:apolipoprotein D and lipocalin family protein